MNSQSGPKTELSAEQRQELDDAFARARAALALVESYNQERVDRLCQAVGWAVANKRTYARIALMSVDESGVGDAVSRLAKRSKIHGVLRDALGQPSIGIIETIPAKG